MSRKRAALPALLLAWWMLMTMGMAAAVESDPLPVPTTGSLVDAVRLYNDGVVLLLARDFRQENE